VCCIIDAIKLQEDTGEACLLKALSECWISRKTQAVRVELQVGKPFVPGNPDDGIQIIAQRGLSTAELYMTGPSLIIEPFEPCCYGLQGVIAGCFRVIARTSDEVYYLGIGKTDGAAQITALRDF